MSKEQPTFIETLVALNKTIKLAQEVYKDSDLNKSIKVLNTNILEAQKALQTLVDSHRDEVLKHLEINSSKGVPDIIKNAKIDFLNRQAKDPRK